MPDVAHATVPQLPLPTPAAEVRWFCPWGCVVERDGECEVVIGGTLVGRFSRHDRERGARNVLMVTLAEEPSMHFGHLAAAFGVGGEYLRVLRRKAEAGGLSAVLLRRARARASKVTVAQQRELCAWFADGATPSEAFRRQKRRRDRLSRATISRERARWQANTVAATTTAALTRAKAANTTDVVELTPSTATAPAPAREEVQLALFSLAATADKEAGAAVTRVDDLADERRDMLVAPADLRGASSAAAAAAEEPGDATDQGEANDEQAPITPMRSRPVESKRLVQHVGTWLMMALAQRDGLHEAAVSCGDGSDGTRIALDATIAALAIGEGCVEGVRRLQTPTVPTLLRTHHAPTASGVRRRLHRLAGVGGEAFVAALTRRYITAARTDADEPAVFYVDNHFRPYAGQEVVRKGWRMLDRCVLPGTSDYYVHDEDGRPVFRVDVPSHDSLTQWLLPIARRLRAGLGPDARILLAFDRGGAFAEQLAELRDAGFEFVTYERKPYRALPASAFDRTIQIRGDEYGVHESRLKNLGAGRGRLRRIALRSPDGVQINLVAISKAPLEKLVAILVGDEGEKTPSGRWQQENAFKHGVERWGLNQLDGRRVDDYPPDTIIPNPARRRLDHALRLARAEEGVARCALAKLADGSPRRERLERDLHDAVARRVELELLRPFVPKHARLADTDLAGKLVRHTGELKALVDVIRIVCANAEADLAAIVARRSSRPTEAKKVVANLLSAPGRVNVSSDAIRVRLAPAANRSERKALHALLEEVNTWNLTLPADARRRPLHFEVQAA
jgi:hypothetical protein